MGLRVLLGRSVGPFLSSHPPASPRPEALSLSLELGFRVQGLGKGVGFSAVQSQFLWGSELVEIRPTLFSF